jgi:hypothetical protein
MKYDSDVCSGKGMVRKKNVCSKKKKCISTHTHTHKEEKKEWSRSLRVEEQIIKFLNTMIRQI